MGLFSKPIKTLGDLLTHALQDIYYAEQQIVKNLPTMAQKATNPELKAAFQKHLAESQGHVKRLEQVFQNLGESAKGVDCQAIDGILAEAKEIISDCDDPEVLDAGMLFAAQAVEHYEITRYGSILAFAKQLGKESAVQPLAQTLQEEKATDQALTKIAESRVNQKAA